MRTLVVYDSKYRNTGRVAETIAAVLGTQAVRIAEISPEVIQGIDLIVIGSPIYAWRPMRSIQKFLRNFRPGALNHARCATFDTRIKVFFSGNAAQKIARALMNAGANLIAEPAGFYVEERDGPLENGELDRARKWAELLKQKCAA